MSKEGRIVRTSGSAGRAVVSVPMTSGRWEWSMRLVRDDHGSETSCFGVMSAPFSDSYKSSNCWMYRSYNGCLYDRGCEDRRGKQRIHPGDTVACVYDADCGVLSFAVNGVDQGVCFSDISGEVFPAVAFYGNSREVELLSLQRVGTAPRHPVAASGAAAACARAA
jgi:hypothetical protein